MNRLSCIWMMVVVSLAASGCGSGEPVAGQPCQSFEDCGVAGDVLCLDGRCHVFDTLTGHGGAVVDLSFDREMGDAAASGHIRFIYPQTSSGSSLSCDDILQGAVNMESSEINPLHAQPKYLVFHWTGGDGFFPDNLVQFIRPADGVLAVAEGFELLDMQGDRTAVGCTEGQTILKDQNVDMVIQLSTP